MKIQIFVKTLTGKNIALDVESTNTVLDIKQEFFERENIPLEQQQFVFNGTYLEDDLELNDYGINDNSSLNIVFRIRGGRRKKRASKKSKK